MNTKTEFEVRVVQNDKQIITEQYKLLVKFETEGGQVKECIKKWAKHFDYNIQMEQRECKN